MQIFKISLKGNFLVTRNLRIKIKVFENASFCGKKRQIVLNYVFLKSKRENHFQNDAVVR